VSIITTFDSAIDTAVYNKVLLFAAASNDGGNRGREFPAKHSNVFCIHTTDGYGNPSSFNPSPPDGTRNFSLLGERVSSHWPRGIGGHNDDVKVMSGTSVATSIAAGLAGTLLAFVKQYEHGKIPPRESLAPRLKSIEGMSEIWLKTMVRPRRDYDYIIPDSLFAKDSSKEKVYNKIKDILTDMYR
jgi:hypothetical protein